MCMMLAHRLTSAALVDETIDNVMGSEEDEEESEDIMNQVAFGFQYVINMAILSSDVMQCIRCWMRLAFQSMASWCRCQQTIQSMSRVV